MPMTEIEVSRSIFRSGDSEYRINGKLVRLLDVQELLAESGIGRALHTVVGQGQLEEVLLSRPGERRKYIEEAAGIAKHRRRKERAERKLAGLDQDLLRLQDVMSELRRQLKPLKQQAEMAQKHETLTAKAEDSRASSPPRGCVPCCRSGTGGGADGTRASRSVGRRGRGSTRWTETSSPGRTRQAARRDGSRTRAPLPVRPGGAERREVMPSG